jgi:hydroxymethylbilane synthase
VIYILTIGTRGSKLALIQAQTVKNLLAKNDVKSKLVIVKTSGDRFTDKPFREAGIGAFVREIDDQMLAGDLDIAVHSMKDIPTKRPNEIAICAVLPRKTPYDVLVIKRTLRDGAVIGTSSLRRQAQLARYFPNYVCKHIRGNIETRINKLKKGEYDAVILAEAGLERLDIRIKKKRLPFIPSPNQGIIAVTAHTGIEQFDVVRKLNDERTCIAGAAERIVMEELGGGCLVPLGILAHVAGTSVTLAAEVLSFDGQRATRVADTVPVEDFKRESRSFAKRVNENGGADLIAELITTGIGA